MNTTNTLSPLELLFHAAAKKGFYKPSLRACGLKFTLAPATGKNKDSIYVTQHIEGTYLGKITNGRVLIPHCSPSMLHTISNVMELPKEAAIRYGHQTGSCSICGRRLDNAASVQLGIGPICAEKLGIAATQPRGLAANLVDML